MEGIVIRAMSQDDLPQVHAIENQCFTTPWRLSAFQYEIDNVDAILKVAVIEDRLVGYACIRSILDVTHIMDLAVAPKYRRMGIGSMILKAVLQELRKLKPDTKLLTLEVRESNLAAIKLYEKFGFKEIGRRRGYYNKPAEDGVIMELDIGPHNLPFTFH